MNKLPYPGQFIFCLIFSIYISLSLFEYMLYC